MTLIVPSDYDELRAMLANGRRKEAAKAAEREARTANADRLRELVGILAEELREVGDRHAGKGRPPLGFYGRREFPLMAAQYDLNRAVIARHILDGDRIGPETLALFVFFAALLEDGEDEGTDAAALIEARAARYASEPAAAAAAVLAVHPFAEQTIGELGLGNVKRQGFASEYRRRLVKRHRVEICAKRLTVPKVSR